MVIVRLVGGLGNQMFQYAAGRAVAYRHEVPLKLDISAFERYGLRTCRLHHLNIVESYATPAEVARLARSSQNRLVAKLYTIVERCLPYYKRSVFRQRYDHFDPDILRVSRSVYLTGYWQSEKYFKDIEEIIRREFTIRNDPDAVNQEMAAMINKSTSVSLHIRRGDYVSNPRIRQTHGVCSLDYYEAAVAKLMQFAKDPHFFVFSDDIEWAKQNLKLQYPLTFVSHNGPERDYEDLRLMSLCKHHIIANSTFSWWGAWLSTNRRKIVIAPKRWFSDPDRDSRDLIPESWLRV